MFIGKLVACLTEKDVDAGKTVQHEANNKARFEGHVEVVDENLLTDVVILNALGEVI